MVWKMLFEEIQDGCLLHGLFSISEWDDFSYSESPCCRKHSIKFLLKRIFSLESIG